MAHLPSVLRVLSVALFLLAAWLLVPRPLPGEELLGPVRVALVDASASVRRTRPDWPRWVLARLREEADAAREEGASFAVVSYARGVGRGFGPGTAEEFLELLAGRAGRPFDPRSAAGADDASRLAAALEVGRGLALAPGRRPGTIVLVGADGWTGDDPTAELVALANGGARVLHRQPPPPERTDLAVRSVDLPQRIEAGAPLLALVWLDLLPGADAPSHARLAVELETSGLPRRFELRARLPETAGSVDVPVDLGPAAFGRTEVRIEVTPLDAAGAELVDPVFENDRGAAATRAAGELVLLVAARGEDLGSARAWLAPSGSSALAGIQFRFAALEEVPFLLEQADALISFDVALRDLPEGPLQRFVERGGGWLATSGSHFLEDWVPGEPAEGLHGLLPLAPAPLEAGERDVLLLVDGSGSMEGEPFDTVRTACLDLVAAALPSDEVALRFFTTHLLEAHLVKPRTDGARVDREESAGAARRLLALRVPEGDTQIMGSLEELARARRGARNECLALFLSDGLERQDYSDPAGRAQRVLAALAETRTALRPIAIGAKADREFLALLARAGEEVLAPSGLEDLREIFHRAVTGARCREGAALALAWVPSPTGSTGAQLGLLGEPLPPVERFVKNELRPEAGAMGAEVLWQGDRGEPVLALARAGLGRTAVFASLPGEGWAAHYTRRLGLGEPARFAGLLRWLARGPERRPEGLSLSLDPDGELVLSGLGRDWPATVPVSVLLSGDSDAREAFVVELRPPALGAGGDPLALRVGVAPIEAFRDALAALAAGRTPYFRLIAPDGEELFFPIDLGTPPEFVARAGGPDPLRATLAAVRSGRGRVVEGPAGAAGHPAGPWVLALGSLCLALGFLLRRGPRRTGQGIPSVDR